MPQKAIGLPDPDRYGDHTQLPIGKLIDYVVQKHQADRAGLHTDLRLGTPDQGLMSWAVRKGMPEQGQKHLAVQQPLHDHSYKDFEGNIPSGYGKGNVTREDLGEVLVTRSAPNALHFTVAHKSNPSAERFVLVKTNQGRDGKGWLLINSTPNQTVAQEKRRYVPVSAERAEAIISNLPEGHSVSPKVDGASNIYKLLKDKIEVVSYRTSKKTGGPITHTERAGLWSPYEKPLPKELEGTTLRGELYGTNRDNKVIPPQELGGLLNSSISKSLRSQEAKQIDLKSMLFDIDQLGKKPIDPTKTPYLDRHKMLEDIMKHLPSNRMSVAPQATDSESAKKLWNDVKTQQHPLTTEGVIINRPTQDPMKAKLINDYDVHIKDFFPGEGKYKDNAVGGFRYSLTPDGNPVGKVGTGFTDENRRDMFTNPDNYIGRTAKIMSQEQLPSGAYRAPSFWALHEDPRTKSPSEVESLVKASADNIYVGEDSYHSKEKIQKMMDGFRKNYPEMPSDYRATILHGVSQPWRDVGRYFTPKNVRDVPRTLLKIPALAVPNKYLPEDMASLPSLLNYAGDVPDRYQAFSNRLFNTINMSKNNFGEHTLAHEIGHSLQDRYGLPYKNDADKPFDQNHPVGSELNDEFAAHINTGRMVKKPQSDGSLAMGSYLHGNYNYDFGMTGKELEMDKPSPADKAWNKSIPSRWSSATQTERARLLRRAISDVINIKDYDPDSGFMKSVKADRGKYNLKLLDQDFKRLPSLADTVLKAEIARMNKQAELSPEYEFSRSKDKHFDRYDIHTKDEKKRNAGSMVVDSSKDPVFFSHLRVLPEYRGKGLGKHLLEQALASYPDKPISLLARPSYDKGTPLEALVKLYESVGFKQQGPKDNGIMMHRGV